MRFDELQWLNSIENIIIIIEDLKEIEAWFLETVGCFNFRDFNRYRSIKSYRKKADA